MTPQCGICTAYRPVTAAGPGKGLCCLLPPVPICAGMIQPTQGLAGIRAAGPQPLMLNARPQVADTDWCAQFHPTPEAEAINPPWLNVAPPTPEAGPTEPWSGAREVVE